MTRALLAITATGLVGACDSQSSSNGKALIKPRGDFLTSEEMTFLSHVADQILPRTDTPGAVDAGVPDVINALLADWADATYRQTWRLGLAELSSRLRGEANEHYHTLASDLQAEKLSVLDAEAFDAKQREHAFYPELKSIVCTAYYLSKPGATEELRYEPVPGSWVPCIPFESGDRAWLTTSG